MSILEADSVNASEIDAIAHAIKSMPTDSQVGFVLRKLLDNIADGRKVVLDAADRHFSPSEAAQMLDMSRTHFYKLLDSGTIAFVSVGRDRRISLEAIASFKAKRDAESKHLAERFANAHATRDSLIDDLLED